MHFPEAKAEMFAGQVGRLTGHPDLAEGHARAAISAYLATRPDQHSYGDIALARIDLAAARLTADDVDGAQAALEQVFSLPTALRIEPLREPLEALGTVVAQPRYRTAPSARDLHGRIKPFTSTVLQTRYR